MSDFVSLYQLLSGLRPSKDLYLSDGRVIRHRRLEQINAVSLKMIATSIDDETYSKNLHYFDKYGRYSKSGQAQKDEVLIELSKYGRLFLDAYPNEFNGCIPHHPQEAPEIHYSGWMVEELPDFEACYEKWQAEYNKTGKEPNLQRKKLDEPRKSNTVWDIAEGLIRAVITEHLSSKDKTTNDIVAELVSGKSSTETMRLLHKLEHLAPNYFTMDEKTFRIKLKEIFKK